MEKSRRREQAALRSSGKQRSLLEPVCFRALLAQPGQPVLLYGRLKLYAVRGVTNRRRTLSGHNVVEGNDFKNTA